MKIKNLLLIFLFSTMLFASSNQELLIPLLKNNNINKVVGFNNSPSNIKYKIKYKIRYKIKYKILKTPIIYFKFNSYKLNKQNIKILSTVAKKYKNKKVLLVIKGFSDKPGNKSYNLNLSKKRSEKVKDFLINDGINKKNIIIKFYGNSDLLLNTNKRNILNRRVVINIYKLPN